MERISSQYFKEEPRMKKRIMELIDEAIINRLEEVQHSDEESEHDKNALKETKDLMNMRIELEKLEVSHQEQLKKMEIEKERSLCEEEVKVEEAKKDRWVQIGICAAGVVLTPIIAFVIDRSNMKALCNFEKDYTFTTSFGRGFASKVSRFKK